MNKNFFLISNYNDTLEWIPEYTDNYIVYDKSDTAMISEKINQNKIIKSPNIGYNIYDYLTYIIDHYDSLPGVIIFAKGNVVPRHASKEYFDQVINNESFTPILDRDLHGKSSWPISFFGDGLFHEINNSWYLKYFSTKYFHNYNDFLRFFFKSPKIPFYVKFAPGANYVVPKDYILKFPKIVYENLRLFISHCQLPGEAHILERGLYNIWTSKLELSPNMLKPLDKDFTGPNVRSNKNRILTKVLNKARNFFGVIRHRIKSSTQEELSKKTISEIKEYRKAVKVYDVFTYNGETDILEIRLNILNDSVDKFIIVEAPTTFSGLKKPLYFEEQKERFAQFKEKIKYFVIEDYPSDLEILSLADKSPSVPKNGPEHWKREFYQKESIKKALLGLDNNDICFVGDVDEIWNPETPIDYRKDDIFKLKQIVSTYYLNNVSSEPWAGTMATKYKNIKYACLNNLRNKSLTKYTYVKNGGWHFTNMGGLDEIRRKLNDSYTEESYNTKEVQKNLEKRFGRIDYMGRNHKYKIDESRLPKYVLENKEKYKNLFNQSFRFSCEDLEKSL